MFFFDLAHFQSLSWAAIKTASKFFLFSAGSFVVLSHTFLSFALTVILLCGN
jgi:hypothetical protein